MLWRNQTNKASTDAVAVEMIGDSPDFFHSDAGKHQTIVEDFGSTCPQGYKRLNSTHCQGNVCVHAELRVLYRFYKL